MFQCDKIFIVLLAFYYSYLLTK